ncbi:MAG: hypothetical protein GX660_24355 [Clostridiaceae bacterium]|nr:hypothetical protein [Clostridiaceae bacterium]
MLKKSKFFTFILSFIPGLGHMYIGFNTRGGIFMFAEIAAIFLTVGGIHRANFAVILIPIIWLACLVDSMVLVDKINRIALHGNSEQESVQSLEMEKQNKKVIAMVLSIIPGTGHMYLGLQRQGLQLMLIFFMSFFLNEWLNLGIFMVFVPVVWFFSLFDVMYKASGVDVEEDGDILLLSWFKGKSPLIRNKSKFIAFLLIGIGCYLILEKIVLKELIIDQRLISYIKTAIIALLFIAGGVKIMMGSSSKTELTEWEENQ